MREILLDIVKHTGGLGFLDTVKIAGTKESTVVESMDNDRAVILKSKLLQPEPGLMGEFGMSRFNILKGYLDFANYRADDATLTVKRKDRNGKLTPEELVFKDSQGQTSIYRFMSSELIPEQAKFLGTNWDVSIEPTRSKIQEFSQLANILSSVENFFSVKTVDGALRFYIGEEDAATDRASLTMDTDVKGELKGDLYWPIQHVLSILKLGLDENLKLSFSNRGALQISMASPHAEYNFLLPARKK